MAAPPESQGSGRHPAAAAEAGSWAGPRPPAPPPSRPGLPAGRDGQGSKTRQMPGANRPEKGPAIMKPMTEEHFAIFRRHMVEVIEFHADLLEEELGKARLDQRVLAAMRRVPRHHFVPEQLATVAYHDGALPIGFDKTISQPFITALMLDLL